MSQRFLLHMQHPRVKIGQVGEVAFTLRELQLDIPEYRELNVDFKKTH